MKAMILAVGKGKRLFPLTGEIPNPMVPVAGKPILQRIFELLVETGLGEVHVNVRRLADAILDVYGSKTSVDGMRVCVTREDRLVGTAGSVKRVCDHFDGTFVVIVGNALTDMDVPELIAFHKERGALAMLDLHRELSGEAGSRRSYKQPGQHRHLRARARGTELHGR